MNASKTLIVLLVTSLAACGGQEQTRTGNSITVIPRTEVLKTIAIVPPGDIVIDNATGDIQVSFTAVEFVILERAISLTQEFSTLSQSNFSDVGKTEAGRR